MYSIDTNLVIGLINEQDRLNKVATKLTQGKGTENLFLLNEVLVEAKSIYLKKFTQALSKIQEICNKQEAEQTIKTQLNGLKNNVGNLQNFYKLIMEKLEGEFTQTKFTKMRSNAVKAINNLVPELEKKLGRINQDPLNKNPAKEQQDFLKKAQKLLFSDSTDKNIFIEFVYISLEKELNELYSNDTAFIKQCKKNVGLEKIVNLNFYAV